MKKNVFIVAVMTLVGLLFISILIGMTFSIPQIIKEGWCHQPSNWPWQMVRYDVALPPEKLQEWRKKGGWSGYTAIGNYYSGACEEEFNLAEVVLYSIFPKTKQEWDEKKRQELAQLVTKSHEQEIRVAFDDQQLGITFESKVDDPDSQNQSASYFYWTDDGYLIEIDSFNGHIKNIKCENCDLNKNEALLAEELEDVFIVFMQRIEPIFTQNHWLESWERYSIDKKGDNTFFRLNHKLTKLNDGTPVFIQVGLDQYGNLLNYIYQTR